MHVACACTTRTCGVRLHVCGIRVSRGAVMGGVCASTDKKGNAVSRGYRTLSTPRAGASCGGLKEKHSSVEGREAGGSRAAR